VPASALRGLVWVAAAIALAANSSAHEIRSLQIETFAVPDSLYVPNTCPGVAPAAPFPTAPSNYTRKYNTIAHKFLDAEEGAGDVTLQMYFVLDLPIDEAVSKLKPLPVQVANDIIGTLSEVSNKNDFGANYAVEFLDYSIRRLYRKVSDQAHH
jgi:hypothetical protein